MTIPDQRRKFLLELELLLGRDSERGAEGAEKERVCGAAGAL